jgi:hypothetical protein
VEDCAPAERTQAATRTTARKSRSGFLFSKPFANPE